MTKSSSLIDTRLYDKPLFLTHILCLLDNKITEEEKEIIKAETLSNGDTLVDNVASIDTALLMEHCEVVIENEDKE